MASSIRSESVRSWFDEPRNRALVERLRKAGINMDVPIEQRAAATAPGPLTGKTYVLTGTFESLTREQATAALEQLGAKVAGPVSKKTTAVFAGADAGSKAGKAEKLGVPLLDEPALLKLIK